MLILVVWIVFVVWASSVAILKRKLNGGAIAITILLAFIIPVLGVILAYTLPAEDPSSAYNRIIAANNMESLKKAKMLLKMGVINKAEYMGIKDRLLS